MKLKRASQFFCSLLIFGLAISARAESSSNGYEVSFAPGLGYSTYSGLLFAGALGVAAPIAERLQLSGRAFFEGSTSGNGFKNSFQIGPTYNFGDDFSRAGFVGVGVGYQTHFPDSNDASSVYGYLGGGYRWLVSERNKISYSPYAQFLIGRDSKASIQIEFLNFSIFF